MKIHLSRSLASTFALGLLVVITSCNSTGKVKDEGAYTTTTKPPAATPGQKSDGTVGGSIGVYSEVGGTSRSVR